jgi:hypothetical protein
MPQKNKLPSSEGCSLKYVLNVAEEIQSQRNAAESVEAASLD